MWIIISIILVCLIILLNIFVYVLGNKLELLENSIILLFNKRNNQIISIYQLSKPNLTKTEEIFKEFFNLKRKDFGENSFNIRLKDKLTIYKKMHNEINFIFKICEQNNKMNLNSIFLYIKDSILDKSDEIGNKLSIYNKIKKEYDRYNKIANFTIIGLLTK